MTKPTSPSPSLLPAVLALFVLLALGYLLFTDSQPSRTEHTVSPPIEIAELEDEQVTTDNSLLTIDQQKIIDQEADIFIDKLADANENAVTVTEGGDEFARHDSHIMLPELEHRTTTVEALLNDQSIADETPLTLNYFELETKTTTLAELDQQIEDKTATIIIKTEAGQIYKAPLADLLANPELAHDAPITLITEHHRIKQLTKAELAGANISPAQQVIATINHGYQELSVKELIQSDALPDDALFYLHRVTERDRQGLWGIVQGGLIERFREGFVLEGVSLNKDRVQVTIPADADEPLPTGLSSFLGKVLNDKVSSSYVYNFSTHTMGHDPNLIYPGQQLILIHFSPDELKRIYLFFAEQRQQQAQSFAIQH